MAFSHKSRFMVTASAVICAVAATSAWAQVETENPETAPQSSEQSVESEDIIVTGTSIRGVSPTGSPVIQMSRSQIVASGATSANDVLTHIPQVTSAFLGTPTTPTGDAGLSVVRPNLRGLPNSASNTTLVLIDGHRLAGAGLIQTTADPDIIPPGVLESVEVVTGGGSSIYGSDAIGGVINFITRKRFDGVEIAGHYGIADDYWTRDINLTMGKDWGSGSAYISLVHAKNDAILGRDRDYVRQVTSPTNYCLPGTIVANGTTYALPGRAPGTEASCDITDLSSFWPAVERNTMFGSLNQSITDTIVLDVRGFYSKRKLAHSRDFAPSGQSLTITRGVNPYFVPIAAETSQVVRTNFNGVIDNRLRNDQTSWGITPTITADFGNGWQMRLMGNFGHTKTDVRTPQLDAAAIAAAMASTNPATALNPYNLIASGATALASIPRIQREISEQSLDNGRVVFDGPLFSLPGGDVRVAVGAEITREGYDKKQATFAPTVTPVYGSFRNYERTVKAAFGEVNVPIVGPGNSMSGIHALTLSGSVRVDDYSDVGSTTNPRLALSYQPVSWITVRGDWSKSFNAPSVVDKSGDFASGFFPFNLSISPNQQGNFTFVVAGNSAENKPQTSTSWSLGLDVEPPVAPGLKISATYYNLKLKDLLSLLYGAPFIAANSPHIVDNLTDCSQIFDQRLLSPTVSDFGSGFGLPIAAGCALVAASQGTATPISFALLDLRTLNLGQWNQDGIDFNASYSGDVGFGTINASVAGSYTLNIKQATTPGAPFVDRFFTPGDSRLFLTASLGAQSKTLGGSVTVNHRQGYDISPARSGPLYPTQDHVDGFTTVDLYLNLTLPEHVIKETSLTLNVQNVFDTDPPFLNGANSLGTSGYTNGSTLGRLVQVGIRKKF